ncbi:hypothetical protein HZH68_016430 [Vespula germanica]|uniref:Uncharacterized protein n=1 Tax=Vespula germanica TaxID=30212 RepID=A0A834MPQ7_VESGE|nr:hypothetical protein HZH68_016430 [Vespula germanica]
MQIAISITMQGARLSLWKVVGGLEEGVGKGFSGGGMERSREGRMGVEYRGRGKRTRSMGGRDGSGGSDGNSSIRDVSRSTRFQWPLEQPALVNRRISALTFSTRPQKISNILGTNQSSPIVFKRQYLVKLSSVRSITQETLVDFET